MAYTALIIAILALWVSLMSLYLLLRDHNALVKSVINSLETPSEATPDLNGSHIDEETTLEQELEAITQTDQYEYDLEQKLIDEGKAVEYS